MKKKNMIMVLLAICSLLCLTASYPERVQAASKKVTTVKSTVRYNGEKEYGIIKGYNKKKKVVWKYKTKGYIVPWGNPIKCVTHKNKVYIFETNLLTILKKVNGKKLYTLKTEFTADYECIFDSHDNVYVIGMSGSLQKINKRGNILWKTEKCECWWHGNIKYKNGKVTVIHDNYNNRGEAKVTYSAQTGEVLRIKYR